MDAQFSLRWINYANQITDAFGSLLHDEDLVDVTLSCEGKKIRAHKMLLSACSPYFHEIFKENLCQHPVIVFQNVQYIDLKAIVEYIYCGKVNVLQEQLESFLSTAEMLEVKGLTEKGSESEMGGQISGSSGLNKNQENVQIGVVQDQQVNKVLRKKASHVPEMSGPISPPAKRKKPNKEKPPDISPVESEVIPVFVKEEVLDVDIVELEDLDDSKCEDSELSTQEVLSPRPKSLKQGNVAESSDASQDVGQDILDSVTTEVAVEPLQDEIIKEPSTEEAVEEVADDPEIENKSIPSQGPVSPDVKILEPKTTSIQLKKRKNISEEIIDLEGDEIPATSENKETEAKHVDISPLKKASSAVKSQVKSKVQIPKGLIVTPIQDVQKVQELFDFPTQELQAVCQGEDFVTLRSEDATTPIQPIPYSTSQEIQTYESIPTEQVSEGEPEIIEETPILHAEQTEPNASIDEVPKEPEFDYFGCEICKDEAKPVDIEKITFNHKCPICPCVCFCGHLLKEHMKIIHGWFNVQRRFTHY